MRKKKEIDDYLDEAFDRVWLMRSHPSPDPHLEAKRQGKVEAILETYDIDPEDCFDAYDYGYWSGIMGALRWVLGFDRDILDT